jgi:hypothetical protein
MRNIKKLKLIPDTANEILHRQYNSEFRRVPDKVASTFKGKRKHPTLNGDSVHNLLQIVFGNQALHNQSQESIDKYKHLLDIFNDVDKVRAAQTEELKSIFSNPVWAIGYDNTKAFIYGRVQFTLDVDSDHDVTAVSFSVVDKFIRSKDIDHIEELIPKLIMTKVHMQQNHAELINAFGFVGESQLIPKRIGQYIPELRVLGGDADTWGSLTDMRWTYVL